MPGNEVGDKVHNFFDQGSLPQDQRHTQFVDPNWSTFNNNAWGANERQIGGPLSSTSKNYSGQPSDTDRGQTNHFSLGSHGLNFTQPNLRPEFGESPLQHQQLNLNGFMHAAQAHARQNEANFLGADAGSERHNLTSRGLSVPEAQQRGAFQHTNSASFGGSESPMNFNFLGGQQQMSGQQSGMLNSLPRQPSGINDAQLLQQQAMYKQMQEIQRQQQFQQMEALQRSGMSHMSTFPNQATGQHSQAINGNSMHDGSNYSWQSQVLGSNTNWQQRGHPSAVHGYSNGLMVTPEQSQAMRFMGLIPQQGSQSLYGVPVSNSRGANTFSHNSIDKSGMLHVTAPNTSFPGNPYSQHAQHEHVNTQDGSTVSRSGSEGKSSFEHASSQGLGNVANLGAFNQVQQKNMAVGQGTGQRFVGGADVLPEKSVMQDRASLANSSQDAVALDPTEEKILFGSDDNIWEAFGAAAAPANDGADLFNGFPSVQSGTWSALMQSAVAETSSGDGGVQEEWTGLGSQNSKSQSGDQHTPAQENEKSPPVWVDSSQRAAMSGQTTDNRSAKNVTLNSNYVHNSGFQQPFSNQRSSPMESQVLPEGRRWLDGNQPKQLVNTNSSRDMSKTGTGFWGHQQSNLSPEPGPNSNVKMGTSYDAVGPAMSNMNVNHGSGQRLSDNNSLDLWKSVHSSAKSGIQGSANDHHVVNKGHSVLDSSVNNPDGGTGEMRWTENGDGRENSTDSHHSSISNHGPTGGFRENVWSDASDRHDLFGGPEKSSLAGGLPVPRKFQYHPMGDVNMDQSSYASKQVPHPQSMSQHLTSGHEAQLRFPNSSDMEKGRLSGFHGAAKMAHGFSSNVQPGYLSSSSSPFAASGENSSPSQHLPPGQHMLELLHKVDQSKDQNAVSNISSMDYNRSTEMPASGHVGPGQSQSSISHGFNLQLAPPSRGIASSNFNDPAQTSLRNVESPSSRQVAYEKGDKSQPWLAPSSSAQCYPPFHGSSQADSGNDRSNCSGNASADGSHPNLKGNATPLAFGSPYSRNAFLNQHTMAGSGRMMGDQAATMSSDKEAYHDQQITNSQNQAVASQPVGNLHNNLASDRDVNQPGMRVAAQQIPPSLHAVMVGMRNNNTAPPVGPYSWTSQQQLFGSQARNTFDLVKSQLQSNNITETSSFAQPKKDEQDGTRKIDALSSDGIMGEEEMPVAEAQSSGKTTGASQEEPSAGHSMDASPSDSTAGQKDLDAFSQSVKMNSTGNQNYSLVHQMQVINSMGIDPSHRESKRQKGPDNVLDAQQLPGQAAELFTGGMNSMVGDPSLRRMSVSAGDGRMLSFSPQLASRNTSQVAHGTVASQDMLSFGRGDLQTVTTGNVTSRAPHSGISPQMAPSWFDQYGSFKNGQLLPGHNVPRVPMMKCLEQQVLSGKLASNLASQDPVQFANAVVDNGQLANTSQIANAYTPSEQVSSLHELVAPVSTPASASMRPKKRKTATSDLLSWNKEIGQALKRLQNMSSAEVDWAQSSNRLVERAETDAQEDLLPVSRSRKRLILTTQLMQQVFCPPPSSVLSLDARTNYEVVVYSIARLALGDACSLICSMESGSAVDSGHSLPEKTKATERLRDQYFSKVMHDFVNRVKELENDLLRLDKRASILDFRLDCQDLERFSVINRFARFHGRNQVDGAEASSSSDATAMAQKPSPQRYVSAHPMPRTVPDRVQCLSL